MYAETLSTKEHVFLIYVCIYIYPYTHTNVYIGLRPDNKQKRLAVFIYEGKKQTRFKKNLLE